MRLRATGGLLAAVALGVFGMCGVSFARPAPDASFGMGGRFVSAPLGSEDAQVAAVARQPDGKLVLAGRTGLHAGPDNSPSSPLLVRLLSSGQPDPAFGAGGLVRPALTGDAFSAVAVQRDGKLVAAGSSTQGFVLARYLSDGSPDPGFGVGGVVHTPVGRYRAGQVKALVVLSDGRIVAGGSGQTVADLSEESRETNTSFALARYRPDGSLDRAFGSGGVAITRRGRGGDTSEIAVLLRRRDGSLIAAGTGNGAISDGDEQDYLALAKYKPNGRLDGHFAGHGLLVDRNRCGINSAVPAAHGRILVAGVPEVCQNSGPPLWRFLADGRLDRGFGRRGQARGAPRAADGYIGVFLRARGRIVVVGQSRIIGFHRSGAFDRSYSGPAGVAYGDSDSPSAALVEGTRRIVAVGSTVNATGTPDTLFAVRYRL